MSITLESFKGHWAGVPYALAALLPGDSFLFLFNLMRESRESVSGKTVKISKTYIAKSLGRSYNTADKQIKILRDLNIVNVSGGTKSVMSFSINWDEIYRIHQVTSLVTNDGCFRLRDLCNATNPPTPVSLLSKESIDSVINNYRRPWENHDSTGNSATSSNFDDVSQTSSNFDEDRTKTSSKFDEDCPTSSKFDEDRTKTSSNFDEDCQTSSKFDEDCPTSSNFDEDKKSSKIIASTTYDFSRPKPGFETPSSSNFDVDGQKSSSNFDDVGPKSSSKFDDIYIDIIIDKKIDERAAGSQERVTLNNGAMSEANSNIGLVLSIKENNSYNIIYNNKYLQSSLDNFREFFGIIFGENFSEEFWEDFEEVNRKEFESHIHSQEEKEIFDFYMDRYDDYPALEDWKELISPRSTITTNMAELLRDAWDGLGYDEDDKEPALVPAKAFDNIVVHAVRRVKEESFEWRLDDRQVRSLFHFQPVLKNGELHFLVHPAFLRDIEKKRESETKDKPKRMSRAEYRMLRICFSDALTEICEKMGDDRLTDAEYAIILLRQRVARLTDANFVEVQTIAYDRYLKEIGEEVNIQPEELRRMWSAMPVRMKQVISPESIDPQLVFEYNRRSSKKASKVEELTWRLLQEWAEEEKRREEEEAEGEDEEGTETD